MPAGYSSTPLAKKLGIKQGFTVRIIGAPPHYFQLFTDLPEIRIAKDGRGEKNLIHYFASEERNLARDLPDLKKQIVQNGMIWISWPKKAARLVTDLTEDRVRALAQANGLVDIKVCAVDEVWSGLKLVIPVSQRK
jgi:hypothetical protein